MFGGKSGSRAAAPVKRGGRTRILRIVGGTWRGRKLRFPASAAIRPTPDRVRETLFNWLGTRTPGARALDLFAGSGALGLEALSRGASHVTFVEHDEAAVRELRARLTEWQAGDARVERADALHYLAGEVRPFDLVFLDPPFASELASEAARMLDEREFFIRKAIGWVLREVSKKRPELTYEFLKKHRDRVSGLSLREGAKSLPAPRRKALGLPSRG